jgi:hypothetical protein
LLHETLSPCITMIPTGAQGPENLASGQDRHASCHGTTVLSAQGSAD